MSKYIFRALFALAVLVSVGGLSAAEYTTRSVPNVQLTSRYNFVSNPDGILSREAVARIDSICYALKVSDIAQIAVVAVGDIVDEGGNRADPFTFAYNLFSEWGVGRDGRDNGLGILFVGDQRQIRFVTGRGLEGVLPDALCKRVQTQYMLPHFRQGNFSSGMVQGVRVVESLLVQSELNQGGSDYYPEAGGSSDSLSLITILTILMVVIVLPLVNYFVAYYRNSRCAKCGRYGSRAVAVRRVHRGDNFDIVEHTFECPHCHNREVRRVREMRDDLGSVIGGGVIIGGGYGASRRSGGFGGGFGGGSFGGGGAGSGW